MKKAKETGSRRATEGEGEGGGEGRVGGGGKINFNWFTIHFHSEQKLEKL